jgi:hypothetical protein
VPQPSGDASRREQGLSQADSILSFAITHAIRECPEELQADVLKLMRRQTELLEENRDLRRLVAYLRSQD